jgi:hypothetical protein
VIPSTLPLTTLGFVNSLSAADIPEWFFLIIIAMTTGLLLTSQLQETFNGLYKIYNYTPLWYLLPLSKDSLFRHFLTSMFITISLTRGYPLCYYA